MANSSIRGLWESVCVEGTLEHHLPRLTPQAMSNASISIGLMHNLKAGGSTLKRILLKLRQHPSKLELCVSPAQLNMQSFLELSTAQQEACRMYFSAPGSTFMMARQIGRPTLLLTSLRPPNDQYVSYYNYACVCNVENRPFLNNCTARTSFEDHSRQVAWQVIMMLLAERNEEKRLLTWCARAAAALGSVEELRFEAALSQMLIGRLSLPCMFPIPTYEINAYLPRLSQRWRPYGLLGLQDQINQRNEFGKDRCPANEQHWLQNAKSAPTIERLNALAAHSLELRVNQRLWSWFEGNVHRLWEKPWASTSCMAHAAARQVPPLSIR